MAKVVLENESLPDLAQIILYIDAFNPEAAQRIGAPLFDLGKSLADFPRRGRPCGDGRRELATVPPYVLRYEARGDDVFVLSIRHGARNLDRPI